MSPTTSRDFVPRRPKPGFEREWEYGRFCLSGDFSWRPSGCYEWTRNPGRRYGAFQLRGRVITAHRAIYIICHGNPGDDVQIHHRCKNTRCVRIDHLVAETPADHAAEHPDIAHFIERAPLTMCVKGLHELSGDNVVYAKNGKRHCRECEKAWNRARSSFHRGDHKTECRHGHPWVPENIYTKPSTGHQSCVQCHRDEEKKRRARRNAEKRADLSGALPTHLDSAGR